MLKYEWNRGMQRCSFLCECKCKNCDTDECAKECECKKSCGGEL